MFGQVSKINVDKLVKTRFKGFLLFPTNDQMFSTKLKQILMQLSIFSCKTNFIANQNNQMLQSQRKKSYRIAQHRKRSSQVEPVKGVLMHIDTPTLEQYRSIDLGATLRSHRIKHKSLSTNASGGAQGENRFKTKWEILVDRYVESKQKIQQRKGYANSSFQFLKLDRTNRFRYIRLARNQALPLDLSKITKMTEQINLHRDKGQQRLKTDYQVTSYTRQSRIIKKRDSQPYNNRQPKSVKEKLLDYFVQNYFNNKNKKSTRENSIIRKTKQDRSSYFTRSIMRNNSE